MQPIRINRSARRDGRSSLPPLYELVVRGPSFDILDVGPPDGPTSLAVPYLTSKAGIVFLPVRSVEHAFQSMGFEISACAEISKPSPEPSEEIDGTDDGTDDGAAEGTDEDEGVFAWGEEPDDALSFDPDC